MRTAKVKTFRAGGESARELSVFHHGQKCVTVAELARWWCGRAHRGRLVRECVLHRRGRPDGRAGGPPSANALIEESIYG